MNAARSEARKATNSATSSGRPTSTYFRSSNNPLNPYQLDLVQTHVVSTPIILEKKVNLDGIKFVGTLSTRYIGYEGG
jgi:hypothetical protein